MSGAPHGKAKAPSRLITAARWRAQAVTLRRRCSHARAPSHAAKAQSRLARGRRDRQTKQPEGQPHYRGPRGSARAQPPDRNQGSPSSIMPSGPSARRRRRSRSPAPFERAKTEVAEEARSSLRRRPRGAGRSNCKRCGARVDRRGVKERSALQEGRPALVPACPPGRGRRSTCTRRQRPTFGAPSQGPPPQLIDNRTNKQIGIRPKVQIAKPRARGPTVRSRRRPSSAPAREGPGPAAVISAPGSAKA